MGVLSNMGYIGVFSPRGCGFSAVLVINRVWYLSSSLDMVIFLTRSHFFIIIKKKINKSPLQIIDKVIRIGNIEDFGHKWATNWANKPPRNWSRCDFVIYLNGRMQLNLREYTLPYKTGMISRLCTQLVMQQLWEGFT